MTAFVSLTAAALLGSDLPLSLPVPGYGRAVFIRGAREEAPLVVALGGSWDRPEWLCEMLDRAAQKSAHLLCLRGALRPERPADGPRWTPRPPKESAAEIHRALESVVLVLGHSPSRLLLAGFSRGAGVVATLARQHPPPGVVAVLLVEGGHAAAERLVARRAAGEPPALRVALGCGTRSCSAAARRICDRVDGRSKKRPSGVQSPAVSPPGPPPSASCRAETDLAVGHSYNPPWERQAAVLLGWALDPGAAAPP